MWASNDPKGLSFRDSAAARNGAIGPINPPNDRTLKVSPLELKSQFRRKHLGTFIANTLDTSKRKKQVSSNIFA